MSHETMPELDLPQNMRAMRMHVLGPLDGQHQRLSLDTIAVPHPAAAEVLIRVLFCGVCHTEIDEIENRAPPANLPMTPGHQVVGTVVAHGPDCPPGLMGKTVGVAWIHSACGVCAFCRQGQENLCPAFRACGRDHAGGYAEYMTAPADFIYEIPGGIEPRHAAPLLCAGAVGYRALRLTQLSNGQILGLTGFGASGQLVLHMAQHLYPKSPVYVFARSKPERERALQLGAAWAGDTLNQPPQRLQAIIDTTPAWLPALSALDVLLPGGRLIINAIRKEATDQHALLELDYARHLWLEKSIQSVANVTRRDVREILDLAARIPLTPTIEEYPLQQAERALLAIKSGDIGAASVLRI